MQHPSCSCNFLSSLILDLICANQIIIVYNDKMFILIKISICAMHATESQLQTGCNSVYSENNNKYSLQHYQKSQYSWQTTYKHIYSKHMLLLRHLSLYTSSLPAT